MRPVRVDPAVEFYDPASHDYRLEDDPRCLFGWGPPTRGCTCRFGHGCRRELGHPGMCDDRLPGDPEPLHCETALRPRNWDSELRERCNT